MKNKVPYSEKLQNPKWQKKRLLVLEHAGWRCQMCGEKERQLHVHHSYYTKGKEPWQYPTGSMIAACDRCHDVLHKTVKQKKAHPVYGYQGEWKLVWFDAFPEEPMEPLEKPIPIIVPGISKFASLKAMLERHEATN